MRYASLIVANMLEKGDEKAPGIKMVNAFLTRVKMPSDYSAERIYKAVLGDRRNREALSLLVKWIKEK
jgi:ribosome-binding factor A